MFEFEFAGWFQCRLATDPDAFDHPRGEDGWTFAFPGEPDLDRIIQFQSPVAPRSHGPAIGVTVVAVRVDGTAMPAHPLVGTPCELLDNAVYEGRNGDIATSASEPVVPFAIRFTTGNASIVGRDPIDLTSPTEITRRQPIDFVPNSAEVKAATGITNFALHRQTRRLALEANLAAATDPIHKQALEGRIAELQKGAIRLTSLGFQLIYEHSLRGPNDWSDTAGLLGAAPGAGAAWGVRYWMGGWDADALAAFVSGTLTVA